MSGCRKKPHLWHIEQIFSLAYVDRTSSILFRSSRFTATKRSRSRHPEPTPLPGLRRIREWQKTFQFPKITMCLEILHKPRKRQDQNDKARFLFRSFAFYRNKTKPFSSSQAALCPSSERSENGRKRFNSRK